MFCNCTFCKLRGSESLFEYDLSRIQVNLTWTNDDGIEVFLVNWLVFCEPIADEDTYVVFKFIVKFFYNIL